MKIISLITIMMIGFFMNSIYAQTWSLTQCIDTAMVNNKKLKISQNDRRISEQKRKEVKSNLLPKITANGDYKYYTDLPTQLMPLSVFGGPEGQFREAQFGVPHNINANLMLNMPLYNPELYGGIKATKVAFQLTELQYQKAEEEVYFDVTNLYYNAQIIQSQIAFVDSNIINSKQLLKNVTLLNEQLLAKKTDVDKVALQVKQIETKKSLLESKYAQVVNGLKLLMDVSLDLEINVENKIVQSNSLAYSSKTSLDIQLIDAKYSLLSSELQTLKRSRFLPSAYLYGSYGTMGYGYDEKPNDFLKFYTIGFAGVKVTYPLFNGTVTNKKINQKKIELENNDLRKSLVTDQTDMQTRNAHLQRSVAKQTINESELQVELANNIYEQTLLQQKEDVANLTDVLMADNSLREAQQNYITAIIDYLKADLELKKITGNITTSSTK
ncbi:MAG TPA: TolC family protein [Crocinitomicaceae bacterium]|nr:TolC family protein [Crocinitomicaceae bacterium]